MRKEKSNILKIGLTGGIGCGKSMVAKFLQEEGIKIVSADQIARDIVNTNIEVKHKLIAHFGTDIYTSAGLLDRQKVAAIVFSDRKALATINSIVHPYVIQEQEAMLQAIAGSGTAQIAGVEAALIYEAGVARRFDLIIVVSAPEKDVLERLRQRDGLTSQQIKDRIQSQLPLTEKMKRADYVIENDGSIEDLKKKVKQLVQELHQRSCTSASRSDRS
jgi:dephospho-CoA kinase